MIPATDFPVAGLPSMGSSIFSNAASASVRTRGFFEMMLVSCHCVELCKFLQSWRNTRRMTCFWWQLTHNITSHTIRLSLKESCLKINVKNVPTLAGCHLATHSKSESCGSKCICLLIFPLFVLESSQDPSCLCLMEVTLFVRLDGEHPSSGYIISRFDLPQINKIENFVVNPGFVLQVFCFSKLFVIPSYILNWSFLSCTASPFLLELLLLFRRSSYIVPTRLLFDRQLPLGLQLFFLPRSSVTSLRYNDRCTHGTVVKLHMSCWSPFSVVTNQNDPAAAAYFCVSDVIAQCSFWSESRVLDRGLFFQSPETVHCTHRYIHCLHHQN